MSYTLELYFEPAVSRHRVLRYFAARTHFTVANDDVLYENPDTGVCFSVKLQSGRNLLFQRTAVSAVVEINFYRPTYFGVEAEMELSEFVAAFRPRIHDPQIGGMGNGPYSRQGFLNGWYLGNLLAIRAILSSNPDLDVASMPADQLRTSWQWNYHNAERSERLKNRCFVPLIMFLVVDGRPSRVVIWPRGMSVLLPHVDYVLVGRLVSGKKCFGLVPWSEVVEVVRRAGFDTTKDPLDLEYFAVPTPIAQWIADVPLINLDAFKRLGTHQIIDSEIREDALRPVEEASAETPRDEESTANSTG